MSNTIFNTIYFCFILSALLLFATSCENDPKQNQLTQDLLGHWELSKALDKDGREAAYLDGVFFEFRSDGQFKSNLPTSVEQEIPYTAPYEVKENVIYNLDLKDAGVQFDIIELTDKQLHLNAQLIGFKFDLTFEKKSEIQ